MNSKTMDIVCLLLEMLVCQEKTATKQPSQLCGVDIYIREPVKLL